MALSSWADYFRIEIDNTNVDSVLTDFPVYLNLSTTSGTTSADVSDIFTDLGANSLKTAVFTDDETTECYVEIERWDNAGNKAELWVRVPSVSNSAKTVLYFAYDNGQSDNTTYVGVIGSTPGQTVWDANFVAVYHMNQDPDGDPTDAIKDSTTNANHGTPNGAMTTADLVDGQIGKGIDFEGADDRLDFGQEWGPLFDAAPAMTIEASIKNDTLPTTGTYRAIVNSNIETTSIGWGLGLIDISDTDYMRIAGRSVVTDTFQSATATFSTTGAFKNVAGVNDFANDKQYGYIEGAEVINTAATFDNTSYTSGSLTLNDIVGSDPAETGSFFDGTIDEVRLSKIRRTAAWLKATHYSNNDNIMTWDYFAAIGVIPGVGSVAATANFEWSATGSISGVASLSGTATRTLFGTGSVTATGSLAATATVTSIYDLVQYTVYINQGWYATGYIDQVLSLSRYVDQEKTFILEK